MRKITFTASPDVSDLFHTIIVQGNRTALNVFLAKKVSPNYLFQNRRYYWPEYPNAPAKPDYSSNCWPTLTSDTPLIVALNFGQLSSARILLKAGADPNKPNSADIEPIMIALDSNQFEFIELLEHNAVKSKI